ncbi:tRNA pseudouridine synthase Pus10 [Linum grandiflorum]
MSAGTDSELLSETPTTAAEVAVVNHVAGGDDKEARLLADAIRSLPPEAVKDLLTSEVCIRCILRLFGFRDHFYFRPCISKSMVHSVLGESEHLDQYRILFECNGGEEKATDLSVPPVILENDDEVWSYMKRKYGPELGFAEETSKCLSAKDALKLAITYPLESMLNVKLSSTPSSFRIRLTFSQTKSSFMAKSPGERNEVCKRRKLADVNAVPDRSSNSSETSELFKFPLRKVCEPHYLALHCYRTSVYFGGRYLKFSRNVSQTRWIIDDERMGESSVEEIIGSSILPACQGDSYKFHAAGREDIDVRMLGSGRPFLVEIQNARKIPSEAIIKETETKINSMEKKLVAVKNLKLEANNGWGLMHEGESEKQKQYCALVWISRPLEDEDVQSIITLNDMKISQRTPIRVLHRRSPLDREKIIHWMKIERVAESCQYFLLHLCTQAGTYIKEFVHGDFGRTNPSIGSILGCRAEILQLDVTDVKMDGF